MKDLAGKVAVITGGASGIGLGLAKRFAKDGMKLVLVDIEEQALVEAAKALEAGGAEVMAERVDVSDGKQMDALGQRVIDRFETVHVVCNNAGVAASGPIWTLTEADWQFTLGVNLWGVIHGLRVFTPHLVRQNEGHVVNTASLAGLVSVPGMAPYNASKHAVVTISETLWGELAARKDNAVGVSVLCPGFVRTRIHESERNRPDTLRNPARERSAQQSAMADMMRVLIEEGLPVEAVADRVRRAVVEGEFYVFTHEHTVPATRQRMEAIVDGGSPALSIPEVPGNQG